MQDPDGNFIWRSAKAYVSQDQPQFRTLGYIPGEEVLEDQISCLGTDGITVKKGSTNCWAYWLTGQGVGKIDQYVWVTTDTVTCDDGNGKGLD